MTLLYLLFIVISFIRYGEQLTLDTKFILVAIAFLMIEFTFSLRKK